ncbi:MAG TPA: signal recognition particle receptor subunit alpha, partial [Candidatus Krumholzibacteria bacterium]|nr:signal recognition particle receptor subunit alpha [Candidatus Krumholzibacteria bacterium]
MRQPFFVTMFQDLQSKLEGVFKSLSGQGKLSEENMAEGLREIRRALLAADVELSVARGFVERVREKA